MITRQAQNVKRICGIVGLAISLTGCGGGVCTGWHSISVSKQDKLTDETATEILKHNEYGARLKCPAFKPKGSWF